MPDLAPSPAPSSPSPWITLLPAALAGTRRQPFGPLPGLTPALGSEADAPEKQLLLTAANLRLVQRASQRPLPGPADSLGRPATETLPVLGAATAARLRELAATKSLHLVVTPCVDLAQGYRLAHRDLARLLTELPDTGHEQLLCHSTLGGTRGEWLLAWHPRSFVREARYLQPLTTGWWLADASEREDNLKRLARQRPPGGWEWLLSEWQAGSPAQREELFVLLSKWAETETLPPSFYQLVEAHVAAWQAAQPPPGPHSSSYHKPYWLGVQSPPEVLARVPGSALLAPYWAKAQLLLAWEPGAGQLTVTLPRREDAEWAAYRWEYTFDQRAAWPHWVMLEVLGEVAHSRWAAAWHLAVTEAVALAAASPHAHWLLSTWLAAATRFQDLPAIRALLALPPWPEIFPRYGYGYNYQLFLDALERLPEAEQVAWRLQWLPTLPHAPLPLNEYGHCLTPNWLDWASHRNGHQPLPLAQQLGLVAFMGDSLALPAGAASPIEGGLARLLRDFLYWPSLPLVEAIETRLLPLARAQGSAPRPLGKAVLESWPLLAVYRTFATTLAASAT